MGVGRLEHVNITVSDPEKMAAMLGEFFGWKVRWKGPSMMGGLSVHVGEEDTYLAVYSREPGKPLGKAFTKGAPMNHIGVLVDDLDAVEGQRAQVGERRVAGAEVVEGDADAGATQGPQVALGVGGVAQED